MSLTTNYNLKYQVPGSSGAGGQALDANFQEINTRSGPSNWTATTNPIATSDSAHNYLRGSLWLNTSTGVLYSCTSATPGSAIWVPQNLTPDLSAYTLADGTRPFTGPVTIQSNLYLVSDSGGAHIQGYNTSTPLTLQQMTSHPIIIGDSALISGDPTDSSIILAQDVTIRPSKTLTVNGTTTYTGVVYGDYFITRNNSSAIRGDQPGFALSGTSSILWSADSLHYTTKDTGILRGSSGTVKITDGSTGYGNIDVGNVAAHSATITATSDASITLTLAPHSGTQSASLAVINGYTEIVTKTGNPARLRVGHDLTYSSGITPDYGNFGTMQLTVNNGYAACFSITESFVATGHFGFPANSNVFVLGSDGSSISLRSNPTAALGGTERLGLNLSTGQLTTTGLVIGPGANFTPSDTSTIPLTLNAVDGQSVPLMLVGSTTINADSSITMAGNIDLAQHNLGNVNQLNIYDGTNSAAFVMVSGGSLSLNNGTGAGWLRLGNGSNAGRIDLVDGAGFGTGGVINMDQGVINAVSSITYSDTTIQTSAWLGNPTIAQVLATGSDAGTQSLSNITSLGFADTSTQTTAYPGPFNGTLASGDDLTLPIPSFGGGNINMQGGTILGTFSFFGMSPVGQQGPSGNTSSPSMGLGTPVLLNTTFDGGSGSAYTVGDIILVLKTYGLLAA